MTHPICKAITRPGGKAALAGLCICLTVGLAQAESLFRAGVSHQVSQPFTPHSLFAVPRPNSVGDIVTISINEVTQVNTQQNTTLSKEQTINENGTDILNNFFKRVFLRDRNTTTTGSQESNGRPLPSPDGLNNTQEIGIRGQSQKIYSYRDNITCQVVQVLPNGNLVIQGRKTLLANNERQELYVTGIVNPYYLDARNTISSQQVANMQLNVVGRGPMSRQQGDGVWGKYMQFFN